MNFSTVFDKRVGLVYSRFGFVPRQNIGVSLDTFMKIANVPSY